MGKDPEEEIPEEERGNRGRFLQAPPPEGVDDADIPPPGQVFSFGGKGQKQQEDGNKMDLDEPAPVHRDGEQGQASEDAEKDQAGSRAVEGVFPVEPEYRDKRQ